MCVLGVLCCLAWRESCFSRGCANRSTGGWSRPSTGIQWMLFTRSHYMFIAMERGRSVTTPADFAKLSPEEKVKTNYARVWNEKNQQIFAANGGTYTVEEDTIHQKLTIALYTSVIGADRVL